jgi:putative redox protein
MKERSARVTHIGGMRFEARTGTGREVVFGERPEANEHSPVEIIVAAVGACTAMDVVSILGKKRQAIDSYEIEVDAVQRDEHPQVLTTIDVVHVVAGPTLTEDAVRRCIELSATKYCPVNAMLSAGATVVHHRYRMRNTGPTPFEAEGEVIVTGPGRFPEPVP